MRIALPDGPRELFEAVAPVFREFFGDGGYRMGGGTVLAALWGHRHSTEVELFAEPSRYREVVAGAGRELERALVERVPGVVAARSRVEPEGVYLECGGSEVTLMPGARLYPEAPPVGVVGASGVAAEPVEEILGKKIRWRMLGAGSYLLRDLYDVAFAQRRAPEALRRALSAEGPRRLRQLAAEMTALDDFEGALVRPVWTATKTEIRDAVAALCREAAEAGGA